MKLDSSVDRDALRMVSTMLRFVRAVDHGLRDASDVDLGLVDLSVLAQISRGLDLPSLVARELHLDPPRVTRITDRLAGLGYIERDADPVDRRRCRLSVTPTGEAEVRRRLATVSRVVDDALSDLPVEKRAALAEALEAVRPVLDGRNKVEQLSNAH